MDDIFYTAYTVVALIAASVPVITDGMWKLCPYVSAGVHRGMHLKIKVVSMIRFATRRDRLEGPGGGHDVKTQQSHIFM